MADHTPSKLDSREEMFCIHILAGKSQTAAYKLAYQPQRAQVKTVHEMASKLAATHKVRTRLAELFLPIIAKARLTRERWLNEVAKCALFDVRRMFDEHGNPKEITELDDTEAAAIGGFEFYEDFQGKGESRKPVGYTKKFKLTDRLRALELYGKGCGYYADRQELTGRDGQPLENVTGIKVEFVEAAPKR